MGRLVCLSLVSLEFFKNLCYYLINAKATVSAEYGGTTLGHSVQRRNAQVALTGSVSDVNIWSAKGAT